MKHLITDIVTVFMVVLLLIFSTGLHLYEHICFVDNEMEISFFEDGIHDVHCVHYDDHDNYESDNNDNCHVQSHTCSLSSIYLILCQYCSFIDEFNVTADCFEIFMPVLNNSENFNVSLFNRLIDGNDRMKTFRPVLFAGTARQIVNIFHNSKIFPIG